MIKRIKNKLIFEGLIRPKIKKGHRCIIMYHGVDAVENMRFNGRFFSAANFEKQVAYYKKNYNVISLENYFENRNTSKDKLNIAITFDDGYQNNLKYALPILEKYQAPATFFITGLNTINENMLWADLMDVCTPTIRRSQISFNGETFEKDANGKFSTLKEYIKKHEIAGTELFKELKKQMLDNSEMDLNDPALFDYWKLLSDEEIKTTAQSKYVKIGSHGMYHNNLGNLPLSKAVDELSKSKRYLENLTQYEVNSIGYPDGSYTPDVSEKAYQMGYKYQCAVDYRFSEKTDPKPYLLNRLGLYPKSSLHFLNNEINSFSV